MARRVLFLSSAILMTITSASHAFHVTDSDSTVKSAATSAEAAKPDLAAVLMKKTKVGGHIKVVDARAEHKGKLAAVVDNTIRMEEESDYSYFTTTIPFADVESVWKRRSHTATGLLIGGGIGVVIGLLAAAGEEDALLEGEQKAAAAIGIGLLGAGLGAVIGSQMHSYYPVYQRQ